MVQSTPQCKKRQLENFQNLSSIALFSCLFFDLLLMPLGLGVFFLLWCKSPFNASNVSQKIFNILYLLHSFLVYFCSCCCCLLGWGSFELQCKAPFNTSNMSQKIQNLCFITLFPCLILDLQLLPPGLGGIFLSWCETTLNANNAS